jgi:hypothetical protein
LTTAVNKTDNPQEFTQRYQALLDHYRIRGRKTQPASPNENGDIEQRHYRFKKALDQTLMLRGSREFSSREEYSSFLKKLFDQLNSGRQKRFSEEQAVLRGLPNRLDLCTKIKLKVGPSSTIRVKHNVYSVDSRLIGELITVRLSMLNTWKYGMGNAVWKRFPACVAPVNIGSTIAISLTGWFANLVPLKIIVTKLVYFQPVVSEWPMT